MARKHEAVKLLCDGLSPSAIARAMGISVKCVLGHLYNQVGEGRILRSDIAFSIRPEIRAKVEAIISVPIIYWDGPPLPATPPPAWKGSWASVKNGGRGVTFEAAELEEAKAYCELRGERTALGDMYEWIYEIEVELHKYIRWILLLAHGDDEAGWWKHGVPEQVRIACQTARESDPDPARDAFCYTNFIHPKKILDANWRAALPALPARLAQNKREFLEGLEQLNGISNRVMHPCKGMPPSEDNFLFVHGFISFMSLKECRLDLLAGAASA